MHEALTEAITVREGIARALEDAGVDMVFGMPGGHTGAIYDALYDHRETIRAVLVREESLAGIMAQVYGRMTGRPGVAIGQAAFMLSASAGALEAHLSSYPMVILTDLSVEARFAHLGAYQSGSGEYGSWDARGAFAGFMTETMLAHGGNQSVQATQLALAHANADPGGSVAVLFPREALRGRVTPETAPAIYLGARRPPDRPRPPAAAVARVAQLLRASTRVVVVAGNGVHRSQAYTVLGRVAVALGVPVVTTPGGKSAFVETHELSFGVFGTFGTDLANATVGGADVVLAIGTRLAPSDTANHNPLLLDPSRQTIIQIDVDGRNVGWTHPADDALVGDASEVLELLAEQIDVAPLAPSVVGERSAWLAELRHDHPEADLVSPFEDGKLSLREAITTMSLRLPESAVVCADAGENRIFLTRFFQTKRTGSFVQASGIGTMGYAIPAALSAKLVHPDRPVVAVCGDGGFAMSMSGLLTAIEEDIPIVVVVLNNAALGWVVHGQRARPIACSFGAHDFAALASAMGCDARHVSTPAALAAALDESMDAKVATVIEVQVSLSDSYEDITSPLAG
ncbi:MAG: acetolactate synthase large subunit [Acidimicrobiaceae bacterium]